MSKFDENRKKREKMKEQEEMRKQKLSGFFYNLALATFSALVLGIAVASYQGGGFSMLAVILMAIGAFLVFVFSRAANNLLKY